MKILIVTPHIFAGGAEKAILNLAYNLNVISCNTSIMTLSLDLTKLPPHFTKLNFILPKKPLEQPIITNVTTALISTIREIFSFVTLLKKHSDKFDLICTCNFPSYWATHFAQTKQPVLWLSSEVLGPVNQTRDIYDKSLFFRLAFRLANIIDKRIVNSSLDPIVTCSKLNSHLIKQRYERNAIVINTGVDYEFFAKVPDEGADLKFGGDPILLHVGALMQRKNQILSIQALKTLKQHLPRAKLVLVGTGPWETALKEESSKLGLEKDVIFMGNISEIELRLLYHACDINLFPVKDQTWGLVPFEALTAGKPSIVARGAGAAEIIQKERIGFLVNPNVKELVASVLFALTHPNLTEDMVKRGQKFVRENLTWKKYAQDMHTIFKRTLNSKCK